MKAIGIPMSMFTVIFAISRTIGWIAHWNEMHSDPDQKIGRPRQLYTGQPCANSCPSTSAEPDLSWFVSKRRSLTAFSFAGLIAPFTPRTLIMKSPLLLSSALLLSACQSAPTTETLYIQDKLADCVGVAPP